MIFSAVFYTLYISKTSKGCFKTSKNKQRLFQNKQIKESKVKEKKYIKKINFLILVVAARTRVHVRDELLRGTYHKVPSPRAHAYT